MDKKYILISMEDDRAKKIADILGNKTCKKIMDLLTEKESSEKDIASALNIPINTVEYNLKKLLNAELIEKTKNFFWSRKGRKIEIYKLSNKSIIISPKGKISSQIKTIIPVVILSGIGALIVRQLTITNISTKQLASLETMQAPAQNYLSTQVLTSLWFFVGACFAIVVFVLLSLRKINKGEGSKI